MDPLQVLILTGHAVKLAFFLRKIARESNEKYQEEIREWEARFPPITDEEFLALCEPGTDPRIALRVRWIISDCLGVEYERIYPNSRLIQDLGAC